MRGENIRATLEHDAGAYARCSYCGRYSDDPIVLRRPQTRCDCGKAHGWSGSFLRPGPGAKWSSSKRSEEKAVPEVASDVLLGCPFCGGIPERETGIAHGYWVPHGRGCPMRQWTGSRQWLCAEMITAWQHRQPNMGLCEQDK